MPGATRLTASASTADPDACRAFYEDTLDVESVADDPWTPVFYASHATLRVGKVDEVDASPGTILGWSVDDVRGAVESLAGDGEE